MKIRFNAYITEYNSTPVDQTINVEVNCTDVIENGQVNQQKTIEQCIDHWKKHNPYKVSEITNIQVMQ